jgi:hypothetical protein
LNDVGIDGGNSVIALDDFNEFEIYNIDAL